MLPKSAKFAAAALSFAMAAAAHADLFSFNPNGTGSTGATPGAAFIDEAPGNIVAIGQGGTVAPGQTFQALYQANLSAIEGTNSGNVLFANGTGGRFFTFTANFTETVIAVAPTGCPGAGPVLPCTAAFQVNPGGTFTMYAAGAAGNDLAGTGFNTGTPILTGTFIATNPANGQPSNSAFTDLSNTGGLLDNSPDNVDQWSGAHSLNGLGAANLQMGITFVNNNYFPDLVVGTSLGFLAFGDTNSSLVIPFNQVEPSQHYFNGFNPTIGPGCQPGAGVTGGCGSAVNGFTGPDFVFQADATTSLQRRAVPEPISLALVGLGLAGAAAFSRRRNKAQ